MNNKILLKKSSTAGKIPLPENLAYGELALNYSDGKLYYKRADNQVKVLNASEIEVSLVSAGNTVTSTVTNVTSIRFDQDSNFSITETSTGTAKIVSLGFAGMKSDGTSTVTLQTGFDLVPETNGTQSLGSYEKPFKDLYVSTGSIYIGGAIIQADADGEVLIQSVSTQTGVTNWNSLRAKNLIIGTQEIPAYAMAENLTGILFPDGKFQPTAAPRMYTNRDAQNGFTINDLYPGDFYYDDVTESIYITVDTGLGYYDLLDLTVRA